jgi:DNA-binding NtrC family response regulator
VRILIVDDEQVALTSVRRILKRRGFRDVEICENGKDAIRRIKEGNFDLVLLDILMPEVDGLQVLEKTRPYTPLTEFIVITALDDISTAVKAIHLGAFDYLVKPLDQERLFLTIERAYERKGLRAGLAGASAAYEQADIPEAFSDCITRCPHMRGLLNYAQIMARGGTPILITGETGTGKELLARGIHRAGPNPDGPFIPVNVSSVPETLFESLFFGHTKGAFTGAANDHAGFFEQADGGTLFLDEIGELPLNLQVKLLRALEDKTITRLGETKPRHVDVRLLSTTNRNLDQACQDGRFRLDLLYRLKSAHIHLLPLRERPYDIPLLASHYLQRACSSHHKTIQGISPEAMDFLTGRDYPGNIRELAQLIERAVLLADSGLILPLHLGEDHPPALSQARSLHSLKENEETHVVYVLTHTRGDRKQAAQILGVTVRQVQRKLAQMRKNPRWEKTLEEIEEFRDSGI